MDTRLILGAVIFVGSVLINPLVGKAASLEEPLRMVGGASSEFLSSGASPVTQSCFSEEFEDISEGVPFETEYRDDEELEWGQEEVLEEGRDGERVRTYRVIFWDGKEVGRELVEENITPAEPRIIARGTKIVWREVPGEGYRYWAKFRVWATSYDSNCVGCRGLTCSGTPVRQGVCAVDPAVIPLGTNFYVPGYGICRAEDIGGGIKGKEVDLGFEDVSKGFWSARYTDVYLLTNAPE